MIRNAVIHAASEQPLLADLYGVPTSTDAGLLCTNLRTMDGRRPVFIDQVAATFFFPYHVIRFVEIPPGALARHLEEGGAAPSSVAVGVPGEVDPAESRLPVPVTDPASVAVEPGDDLDLDLDIDEGFLQRVRDI